MDEQNDQNEEKMHEKYVELGAIVRLSVGGVRFETTRATLMAEKDSVLAAMFIERQSLQVTEDGCQFIDRNGSVFGYILDYLRGEKLLPSEREAMDRLRDEAAYFQLSGLISAIDSHDMNSRKLIVYYVEKRFEFRLNELRKERGSVLAEAVSSLYQKKKDNGECLMLDITPYKDSDGHKPKYRPNSTEFVPQAFRDMLPRIGFQLDEISQIDDWHKEDHLFPRYQCCEVSREGADLNGIVKMCIRLALIGIEYYLKNREISFDAILETELAKWYFQRTIEELRQKARDKQFVQKILRPSVCVVAKYFGLFEFVQTLEAA